MNRTGVALPLVVARALAAADPLVAIFAATRQRQVAEGLLGIEHRVEGGRGQRLQSRGIFGWDNPLV